MKSVKAIIISLTLAFSWNGQGSAMNEQEHDLRPIHKTILSSQIPIVNQIEKLPESSIEKAESPVVKRKISITAPMERRRKSSGSSGVGKIESQRTSVSPSQVTTSSSCDEQSGSSGQDESPVPLLEHKSSSQEEQSASPVFPQNELLVSSGRLLTSSQENREASQVCEQKNSLNTSKYIESSGRDGAIAPLHNRKNSNGMRRVFSPDKGNQDLIKVFLKPTPTPSQKEKKESPRDVESMREQENSLDSSELTLDDKRQDAFDVNSEIFKIASRDVNPGSLRLVCTNWRNIIDAKTTKDDKGIRYAVLGPCWKDCLNAWYGVPGHEEIFKIFLNGKLIFRPISGIDVGMIEWKISDLKNPFAGTFDLSEFGDVAKDLVILYDPSRFFDFVKENYLVILITTRFLIQKNASIASLFEEIMLDWDEGEAPIGLFWRWGNLQQGYYDYLTNADVTEISSRNLFDNCIHARNCRSWWGRRYLCSTEHVVVDGDLLQVKSVDAVINAKNFLFISSGLGEAPKPLKQHRGLGSNGEENQNKFFLDGL